MLDRVDGSLGLLYHGPALRGLCMFIFIFWIFVRALLVCYVARHY
jgi:hypothetical protein